jgi:signal transduction histidine kinase
MKGVSSGQLVGRPERDLLAPERVDAGRLQSALNELLADLGYETASLFVRSGEGWTLLARRGKVRAWHGVLDPGVFGDSEQAAAFTDVSTVPGMGPRLSGMGCASVAVLRLPDDGCVVLDSSIPRSSGQWVDRVGPLLSIVSLLAGPGGSRALVARHEDAALSRAFEACRRVVARPETTADDLVLAVREGLDADELFLITAKGDDLTVYSAPSSTWPRSLPADGWRWLIPGEGSEIDPAGLRALTVELGMVSRAVAGALAGEGDIGVVAGWSDGPALSPASMEVIARALAMAHTAIEGQRRTVDKLVDQERTRMAYAIHDGLTQSVAAALMHLEALSRRIKRDPEDAVATLENTQTDIRRALSELRGIMFDLARSSADEYPSEPLIRSIEDVVRRWRLPARVAVEGDLDHVPGHVLAVAYVVIREALANAAKHASTSKVSVAVTAAGEELVIVVGDSGRGFIPDHEEGSWRSAHMGLESLRRRVREIGGSLQVQSQPGRGTRVVARLPIKEVDR